MERLDARPTPPGRPLPSPLPGGEGTLADAVALDEATLARLARCLDDMAVEHRHRGAYRELMDAGFVATPIVRQGLRHASPVVRAACCSILDHFMDEGSIAELTACLSDEHESVRGAALHALACDRCKEGACRPGEADVLPIAIRMLREDPSRRVRTNAADMIGPSVHRSDAVREALIEARDRDPHPMVRKVASWHAPGGPIYRRLRPKPRQRGQYVPRAPASGYGTAQRGSPAIRP